MCTRFILQDAMHWPVRRSDIRSFIRWCDCVSVYGHAGCCDTSYVLAHFHGHHRHFECEKMVFISIWEHCISIIHSIRVFELHSHLYETTFSSCAWRRFLHTPTFRPFFTRFNSIRLDWFFFVLRKIKTCISKRNNFINAHASLVESKRDLHRRCVDDKSDH